MPKKNNTKSNTKSNTKTKSSSTKNKATNTNQYKNINENENENENLKESYFNYTEDTFKIIEDYVKNYFNKHHIDSFNKFTDETLQQIINQFNPIEINHEFDSSLNKYKYEIKIEFLDYFIEEPIIYENNGSYKKITPAIARLRNLSYSAPFFLNIKIRVVKRTGQYLENENIEQEIFTKVKFGKLPIMVNSKYCLLNKHKNISLKEKGECPYDNTGIFIIRGQSKMVVSQERGVENKDNVYPNQVKSKFIMSEIKSVSDRYFGISMINSVKYNFKTKIISVDGPLFKNPVNLFLVMRLLGIKKDKHLVSLIVYDIKNKENEDIIELTQKTLLDYINICNSNNFNVSENNPEDVVQNLIKDYFIKHYLVKPYNKEKVLSQEEKYKLLEDSLIYKLLPVYDKDFLGKSYFLGMMTCKMLKIHLGLLPFDNRDDFYNKRIDTTGVIYASLIRQAFNMRVKDIKKSFIKEIKGNKSNKNILDIIRKNIHKIFKPIENWLNWAFATGTFTFQQNNNNNKSKSKQGVAQVHNTLSYQSKLSHSRRLNSPSDKNNGKIVAPRKLNPTQLGYICPVETPEGQPVGLVKNFSLACYVTPSCNPDIVEAWCYSNDVIKPNFNFDSFPIEHAMNNGKILINRRFLGIHYNVIDFISKFKIARHKKIINPYVSIEWDSRQNNVFIYTDSGRVIRPLYTVDNNKLNISKLPKSSITTFDNLLMNKLESNDYCFGEFDDVLDKNKSNLDSSKNNIDFDSDGDDFESCNSVKNYNNYIEFIDCNEIRNCLISMNEHELSKNYSPNIKNFTHCEFHPSFIFGVMGSLVPFPDYNQSPRNTYQAAMGKQAMGISFTNFNERMDTISYIMNYLERPIVATRYSEILNCNKMSNGLNAIIAIASYTGYNQEDSLILNQGAVERGLFRVHKTTVYKGEESKVQSSGKEEKFCKPDPKYTKNMKPNNYEKLDDNGFVRVNEYVDNNDIIIGKVLPKKVKNSNQLQYRDCSTGLKNNESGFIDKVVKDKNQDGYNVCKIKVRSERIPQIGDKFSSRCGQKGTIGMTLKEENFPYNKDGIKPDAIMNPHAIPSRMTIGQLLECILGKASVMLGGVSDCTPFCELPKGKIYEILRLNGFDSYGNETLYNGMTGQMMDCMIFMGPTFYQRLKHMVDDKMHSRASGPIVQLTRQPPEGRSRDGGLRIGEMERDCMIAHGTVSFLKESMLERSDLFSIYVCKVCGMFASVNPNINLYKCNQCNKSTEFSLLNVPYAYKLLTQELMAMNIAPKLFTN